jgi:hypothetical protein
MRAWFVFVAGLFLAACSASSVPAVNPQMPNAGNQKIAPMPSSDGLRLRLENGNRGFSNLTMYTFDPSFKCIASVKPADFFLEGGQSDKLNIQAKTDPACKDADRAVDFLITDTTYRHDFAGELDVRYSPQAGWTGKIIREFGRGELCTEPRGLKDGVHLAEGELIKVAFCP